MTGDQHESAADENGDEEKLLFTVASVWREQRVSCPHRDILRAWLADSLLAEAGEFVRFHLEESDCPYCNAVLDELRADEEAVARGLDGLKERLSRSTLSALRESRRPRG